MAFLFDKVQSLLTDKAGVQRVTAGFGLFVESFENGRLSGRAIWNMPSLITTSDGYLAIYDQSITSVSFPNLVSLNMNSGILDLQFNPVLASIDFPLLTTCGTDTNIFCGNNPALTSVSMPNLQTIAPTADFEFGSAALSESTVNAILISINNAAHGSSGSVIVNGGTSHAPTGAGLAAKNALVADGWIVTTN